MPKTLPVACLAWAALCCSPTLVAAEACPSAIAGSGLRWEQRDMPDMVFCKAFDDAGGELFSVTLGEDLAFSPESGSSAERGTIDGRKARWHRGHDAFQPDVRIRETLLKLGRGREAHIVVRAPSEDALAERMALAEGLRFGAGN